MPRLSASEVVASQKAHQRVAAVLAMHRVAASDEALAASLHALGREVREAAKARDPRAWNPGGLYRSKSGVTDRRAAGGQSDTNHRQ